MPKLIIHAPAGTFDAADRQHVAGVLTTLGLDRERLPASPMVRSTVWTYFAEYAADAVFMGDEPARLSMVTLRIYVLAGGLDAAGKRRPHRKRDRHSRSAPGRNVGRACICRHSRNYGGEPGHLRPTSRSRRPARQRP